MPLIAAKLSYVIAACAGHPSIGIASFIVRGGRDVWTHFPLSESCLINEASHMPIYEQTGSVAHPSYVANA